MTRTFVAVCLALALAGCGSPAPSSPGPSSQSAPPTPSPTQSPRRTGLDGMPAFGHVYLIIMENRSYSAVVDNSAAPYINSLIRDYGLATDYHSVGSPSQPNYVALVSGSTQNLTSDNPHDIDAPNLADQLESAGLSWADFQQSYPGGCFTGEFAPAGGAQLYARKHNPFISFTSISGNPARCANIKDFTSFDPAAGDFELIVPDQSNDMHNGSTTQGDTFLSGFVPQILQSDAWRQDGVLFIVWDEADGGDQVPLLVISSKTAAGFQSSTMYDHYSLLRSIEDTFGLPCLAAACSASNLAEFFSGG